VCSKAAKRRNMKIVLTDYIQTFLLLQCQLKLGEDLYEKVKAIYGFGYIIPTIIWRQRKQGLTNKPFRWNKYRF